jgi:sulfoxide reductase heme-binding subunit YedZ
MFKKNLPPASISRVKAVLFAIALLPLVRLFILGLSDSLGANPIEFVIRSNGTWALTFLLITLGVTPLRKLTGATWLIQMRRMFGLYAFFYATLHMLCYVWLDQWFDWAAIGKDIVKHPFILAGFSAWLVLIPLAVTSTNAMMRRLRRNWQKLHYLIYPIAMLGVLHYWWLVKKDITQPAIYTAILTVLLGVRMVCKLAEQKMVPTAFS